MWAPAGTVWHQEDAVALLSPHLYSEFVEPCDVAITEAFGGCIMHQHSTGYVPTEAYLEMNMTALELHSMSLVSKALSNRTRRSDRLLLRQSTILTSRRRSLWSLSIGTATAEQCT